MIKQMFKRSTCKMTQNVIACACSGFLLFLVDLDSSLKFVAINNSYW